MHTTSLLTHAACLGLALVPLAAEIPSSPAPFPGIASSIKPAVKKGGFSMNGFNLWCPSIIKVDDTYHMFASRWPYTPNGLGGWQPNSEVVRATSKTLHGPYTFQEVVLPAFVHNPKIVKRGDTFILIFISKGSGGTGYAYSKSITGPWTVEKRVISIKNPALLIREDQSLYVFGLEKTYLTERCPNNHKYTLYAKAFTAPSHTGPYTQLPGVTLLNEGGLVVPQPDPKAGYEMEDPCIWWANGMYHVVGLDWDGWATGTRQGGVQYYSKDGIRYSLVSTDSVFSHETRYDDGSTVKFARRERPFVYVEEEKALALVTAGIESTKEDKGPCRIIINPIAAYHAGAGKVKPKSSSSR